MKAAAPSTSKVSLLSELLQCHILLLAECSFRRHNLPFCCHSPSLHMPSSLVCKDLHGVVTAIIAACQMELPIIL